jgi:hypothetical protein
MRDRFYDAMRVRVTEHAVRLVLVRAAVKFECSGSAGRGAAAALRDYELDEDDVEQLIDMAWDVDAWQASCDTPSLPTAAAPRSRQRRRTC